MVVYPSYNDIHDIFLSEISSEVQKKRGKGDPNDCSQLQKNCMQNILIWLCGRAVKTQLQIVLIRLFAVIDGYPISVKLVFAAGCSH